MHAQRKTRVQKLGLAFISKSGVVLDLRKPTDNCQ